MSVLFGYIPVVLGIPAWIVLPVSMGLVFVVVKFFGRNVPDSIDNIENKIA